MQEIQYNRLVEMKRQISIQFYLYLTELKHYTQLYFTTKVTETSWTKYLLCQDIVGDTGEEDSHDHLFT
jgi:hypothetical protein